MAKPTTRNEALAQLIQAKARDQGYNQTNLIEATGLGKGSIGGAWRGEVARIHPEVAKRICSELGIPIRQFLRVAGYDITDGIKGVPKGMEEIVDAWPQLSPEDRDVLIAVALRLEAPTLGPDIPETQ